MENENKNRIILENIQKTYLLGKQSVPALRGIDIKIDSGENSLLIQNKINCCLFTKQKISNNLIPVNLRFYSGSSGIFLLSAMI